MILMPMGLELYLTLYRCQGENKNTVTCDTNEPNIKYVLASKGTKNVYVNQRF